MVNESVPGTQGYLAAIERFSAASLNLSFAEINQDFLPLMPAAPARVLDLGAGVGQNAAALTRLGYQVTAVEPLAAFLAIAKAQFDDLAIHWLQDSLPELTCLDNAAGEFELILLDGVWHHLAPEQRPLCLQRFAQLLKPAGICAISLRNGPPGVGTHVFETCSEQLCQLAGQYGLEVLLRLDNQASKMAAKPEVFWSRVALAKPS